MTGRLDRPLEWKTRIAKQLRENSDLFETPENVMIYFARLLIALIDCFLQNTKKFRVLLSRSPVEVVEYLTPQIVNASKESSSSSSAQEVSSERV